MATRKTFIAIAGNIGTGKTTLTRLLAEKLGWAPHFESVQDNPYLTDFYQDMKRWSFSTQVYFLNHRFQSHQQIVQEDENSIQDRSIYEDANIFARNLYDQGNMDARDFKTYQSLYGTMCQFLVPPDLIIYLKKSVPLLKERIRLRGREFEKNIPDKYLFCLNDYYDEWMESYSLGNKLIIPSDDLDFLQNQQDFDKLTHKILETLHPDIKM